MKVLEKYINFVGEKISYLIPVMVALMIVVIISRYFFGIGRTGHPRASDVLSCIRFFLAVLVT
jgi:hypothetical protein